MPVLTIKRFCGKNNITVADLAKSLNLEPQQIYYFINQKHIVRFSTTDPQIEIIKPAHIIKRPEKVVHSGVRQFDIAKGFKL